MDDTLFAQLRDVTGQITEAQQRINQLSADRRRIINQLRAQGYSLAEIADTAGITRGRIHQISNVDE
jgi:DNA-directed RNA polymerase specialized sigma24 family protein